VTGKKRKRTTSDPEPAVQWAAFYSDCEHEVHEVTAGHLVTLTYNLYVCRGQGHLAGAAPSLGAKLLPLYGYLKDALASPGFLCRGKGIRKYVSECYSTDD
jgi:hypothetical protein